MDARTKTGFFPPSTLYTHIRYTRAHGIPITFFFPSTKYEINNTPNNNARVFEFYVQVICVHWFFTYQNNVFQRHCDLLFSEAFRLDAGVYIAKWVERGRGVRLGIGCPRPPQNCLTFPQKSDCIPTYCCVSRNDKQIVLFKLQIPLMLVDNYR